MISLEGHLCDLDVDECQSSPCLNGGSCLDDVSSFTCICSAGFTGSNCQNDLDECLPKPCGAKGQCTDKVDGFTCNCDPGFTGEYSRRLLKHNFDIYVVNLKATT